jgi:hypothetical protein
VQAMQLCHWMKFGGYIMPCCVLNQYIGAGQE